MKSNKARSLYLGLTLVIMGGVAQAAYPTYDEAAAAVKDQLQKGDFVAAQKTAEEELTLAKTPDQKAGALLDLGLSYKERKMYPQARQQLTKILELPDAAADYKLKAYTVIGGSYGDENDWGRARAEFEKAAALPIASTQDKANLNLAIAGTLFNENNTVAGRKQLTAIIENTAVNANFRAMVSSQLGQELINEGEFEQARAAFNQTLAFPTAPGPLRIAAQAGIAQSYRAQGDETKAQAAFVKAQTDSFAQSAIAAKAKHYEDARLLAEQALTFGTVAPVLEAVLRTQIASFLLLQSKPEEARTGLEAFLKKQYGPDLPASEEAIISGVRQNAQLTIARTYIAQGNKEQAKVVLQSLLATDKLGAGVKAAAEKQLQELE